MPKQSIDKLIDDHGLGLYQILLIGLCGLIALIDGFDTQSIAFVTPVIAKAWHAPYGSFGLVFAAGLLGGCVGAVVFGSAADRLGRRIVLLMTLAIFGIGSILTAFSASIQELEAFRLFTGLGLGGAMPSIVALAAEYSPRRMRATLVTSMFCGFPLGAVLGALGSVPLMTSYGWRSVFWAGGLSSLILFPAIMFAAPESLDWLRVAGRTRQISSVIARLGRTELWDGETSVPVRTAHSAFKFDQLFREGRAFGSIVFAIACFFSLLLAYLLVSWIPTFAVQSGHSARSGILAAAVLNFGGICGSVVIGRASDRFNAYRVVSAAYALGAVGAVLIGLAGDLNGALVFIFSSVSGVLSIGAQLNMVSLVAKFYPVEIRASGVGFSMAVGRIGAIAGPLVGDLLVNNPDAGKTLAFVAAGLSMATALMILLIAFPSSKNTQEVEAMLGRKGLT